MKSLASQESLEIMTSTDATLREPVTLKSRFYYYLQCCTGCMGRFQIFTEDNDGVPPFCHHKLCPLSNADNYINGNSLAKRLGRCGFSYFDRNRHVFFGFASMFTVFAFILTLWGCFSLSTKNNVVQRTYWVGGTGHDYTNDQDFSMYVGLRSFEYVNCKFSPGYESYPDSCIRESIKWTDNQCKSGPLAPACQACASVATTMWATAFFNCFGLILAFLGAQTRMRPIADIPVQKLLGVCSEFWGLFSLAYALFTFERSCFVSLRNAVLAPNISARLYVGPGLYCYAICCISALVRMTVHWLTPLPGQAGCGGEAIVPTSNNAINKQVEIEMAPLESKTVKKSARK
jgi:hypothetical protein